MTATISRAESGSVEQSFSRRRGFRKNIRRATKLANRDNSSNIGNNIPADKIVDHKSKLDV